MKGWFLGFVLASGLLTLVSCAVTKSLREKGLSPLTQSELEVFYSRTRSCRWINYVNYRGTSTFFPDGLMLIDVGIPAQGSWRVIDGKICTKFTFRPEEKCYTVYRTGEYEYEYFDSGESLYMTNYFFD